MNKYQATAPAFSTRTGQDRRLRIQGAVLGGGIPLLLAAVSYWFQGWVVICELALVGALVGSGMGWRSAQRAAATSSPRGTAASLGVKGALVGACGYAAVASIAIVVLTMDVGFAVVYAVWATVAGVVVGSLFGIPVALLSVYLLRRFGGNGRGPTALASVLLATCLVIGGAAIVDFAVNGPARLRSEPPGTVQTIELFA